MSLAGLDETEIEGVFEKLTKAGATKERSPESHDVVRLPVIVD